MFGIDYGPSEGEIGATNALTGESAFAGTQGEGLLSQDSALISAILSGNHAKIAQLLAPQISDIAKRANQKTQTNAEFANRSGGTNASNQNTMDNARSGVNDLIARLTGGAIGAAGNLGEGLLGTSMRGYSNVFGNERTMQSQRASKWNDLGSGIASIAEGVFGMLPAHIPMRHTTGDFGSFGSSSFG